ncbi:GyrI-like domain-containing protein [Pseudoxanthomonas sp. 10H]|uniref:GyrI-like domain-containing protein n=1 Tax=Pseudoxanthomonas sp. 10H TaxID=3242729 RepID=UPI0035574ABC
MARIDAKKDLGHLYLPSAQEVVEVDVPALRFLMVDGRGDPDTAPAYAAAVQALFTASYSARFALKKRVAIDYAVMPLEGLWWSDDMSAFLEGDRARWQWTLMVMQPAVVDDATLQAGIAHARAKGLDAAGGLRLETFHEGRCAQVLHVGPFSDEGPTVRRVHDFIQARSGLRGRHHEIYLSDVRRAAPARWRTVIRQPMR